LALKISDLGFFGWNYAFLAAKLEVQPPVPAHFTIIL